LRAAAKHAVARRASQPGNHCSRFGDPAAWPRNTSSMIDWKARYHEENIDADEAARHGLRKRMKVDHQHHGNGPQAIDIRPIPKRGRRRHRPIHDFAKHANRSDELHGPREHNNCAAGEDAEPMPL
jgi:hypothetical protein